MNTQWILARTPLDALPTDDDFKLVQTPIPEPSPRQMLTRTIYLSLDPYQWGRRRSGVEAVGEVCHGRTVSQVVKSNLPAYTQGDFVFNTNGWQEYGLTGDGISVFNYMFPRKIDPAQAPISTAVGILGMLGLTAYSGVVLQCKPQAGETVVVSAASGGVGQIAGQIAKIFGCNVVGIAGIKAKCDFVTEVLGFDACVSHRSDHLEEDLKAACPAGIDVYFENVGGRVFQSVLPLLNQQARISLCGLISQYGNTTQGDPHDAWMAQGEPTFERQNVQAHRLTVGNFVAEQQAPFLARMAGWVCDGKVKYKEDLWPGLGQAPKAFRAMLEGGNFGKTLIGVGEDPTLDPALQERRAGTNVLQGSR
ncbi:NADPH-dependent curcumin reductase [Candidatus Entotheonellaceae bacterium PAL068K]